MKKWKRVTYLLTGSFAVNILKYDFVFLDLDNVLKLFLLFYDYMQLNVHVWRGFWNYGSDHKGNWRR